jgi:hypothetical protein
MESRIGLGDLCGMAEDASMPVTMEDGMTETRRVVGWWMPWAAGFFDGEGSTLVTNKNPRRRRDFPTLKVIVTQHGAGGIPDTLTRFVAVAGCGKINGPYQYRGYKTPRYYWSVTDRDAAYVLRILWPYLGKVKREQARRSVDLVNASFVHRREYGGIDRSPLQIPDQEDGNGLL